MRCNPIENGALRKTGRQFKWSVRNGVNERHTEGFDAVEGLSDGRMQRTAVQRTLRSALDTATELMIPTRLMRWRGVGGAAKTSWRLVRRSMQRPYVRLSMTRSRTVYWERLWAKEYRTIRLKAQWAKSRKQRCRNYFANGILHLRISTQVQQPHSAKTFKIAPSS